MLRRPALSAFAVATLAVLAQLTVSAPAHAVPVVPPAHPTISGDQGNSFLMTDGAVRGAGANTYGQLGPSADYPPPNITALVGLPVLAAGVVATSIEGESSHLVAIGSDGRAYGSGGGSQGQLTGTEQTYMPFHELSGLPANENAVEAVISQTCTLILTESGKLYRAGWGSDTSVTPGSGQYGQCPKTVGASDNTLTLMPGVPAVRTVVDVSIGGTNEESTVAVLDDGSMIATGFDDADDRLPGRAAGMVAAFQPLTNLPKGVAAKAVSVDGLHLVVLGAGGLVYGAGSNSSGQLTNGSTVNGWHEMALPGAVPAVQVVAGSYTSSVLGNDGNLYATGAIDQFDPDAATFDVQLLTLMPKPAGLGEITEIDGRDSTYVVRGTDGFVWGAGDSNFSNLTGAPGDQRGFKRLTGQVNVLVSAPSFTGALKYGSTLTAVDATWTVNPTTTNHQWLRDGGPIAGASGPTYVIQRSDAGMTISVRNTATTTNYEEAVVTSASQSVANQIFLNSRPGIKGKAKKGKKLSIQTRGAWSVGPTVYGYRWLRNGAPIKGATKSTYKLKKADKKKRITVRVTAYRAGFLPGVADSYNYKRPTR